MWDAASCRSAAAARLEQPPPRRFVRPAVHVRQRHPLGMRDVELRHEGVAPAHRTASFTTTARCPGVWPGASIASTPVATWAPPSTGCRATRRPAAPRAPSARGARRRSAAPRLRPRTRILGLDPMDHVTRIGEGGLAARPDEPADMVGMSVRDDHAPDVPRMDAEGLEFLVDVSRHPASGANRPLPASTRTSPSGDSTRSAARRGPAASLRVEVRAHELALDGIVVPLEDESRRDRSPSVDQDVAGDAVRIQPAVGLTHRRMLRDSPHVDYAAGGDEPLGSQGAGSWTRRVREAWLPRMRPLIKLFANRRVKSVTVVIIDGARATMTKPTSRVPSSSGAPTDSLETEGACPLRSARRSAPTSRASRYVDRLADRETQARGQDTSRTALFRGTGWAQRCELARSIAPLVLDDLSCELYPSP